MRKLSRNFSEIKPVYDVIIIGSGYGGSIAASRFSRAGLKVCVLEKGKEFQPGDYPSTLADSAVEMQINAEGIVPKENGLYDFHINEDITVFKGCGLGGTSLVNANVSIEPEPRVFDDTRWPSAIRNDMNSLNAGYSLARKVLNPKPYPENTDGYPELAKAKAMKESATGLGMKEKFRYTDINVTFEDGPNSIGYEQNKCNNCGDCVTGCNYSAKNTLIMNYLPDAVSYGAEIFCNINVSHVEKSGDGWLVYYSVFHSDRDKFNAPEMFLRASTVVISGGALGSTELLLRSKENGLPVSGMLGKHFTGNGDALGFAYNCDDQMNGIGKGNHINNENIGPVGPCITSIIDMRNQPVLNDGMTFEEGSIPGAIGGFLNDSMLELAGISGDDTQTSLVENIKQKGREFVSLLQGPYHGATNNMQTFLIMSHDDGNGDMNLENERLSISWPGVGKQPIFEKASNAMLDVTKVLGGVYIKDFVWNKLFKYSLVTVHPLGGCCMGEDASTGVTDHTGNVFTGAGNSTHSGLYVLDGSILPMPLGTNPLFTISAVSERACNLIAQKIGKNIDYGVKPISIPDVGAVPAVQFTESMKGFFSINEKQDYEAGYEKGQNEASPCIFVLTIKTENINNMVADSEHKGYMAGTIVAPALSDKPLTVSGGMFNLFVKDADNPTRLKMKYNMQLTSYDGKQYYFSGFKMVNDDNGPEIWKDTTVLYISIYNGTSVGGELLGMGILKISISDFATQMTTMRAVDCKNLDESVNALKIFSTLFEQSIVDTYFKKLL